MDFLDYCDLMREKASNGEHSKEINFVLLYEVFLLLEEENMQAHKKALQKFTGFREKSLKNKIEKLAKDC